FSELTSSFPNYTMAKNAKANMFSMLRLEDDSDGEFSSVASKNKKKGALKPISRPAAPRPPVVSTNPNAVHLDDGLVVHAVAKKKKGGKNKAKVIDEETGFVVQDAPDNYNEEKKFQQNLKDALRESEEQIRVEQERVLAAMRPEDVTVAQIAKELSTANMGTASIREKMLELQGHAHAARIEAETARAQMEDYKRRYRKVVSILFEAEVQERADLAKKLVTSRQVETDLSEQISDLRVDLERARTKIHELETKLN
ncbi:hypothetical protein PENTCL1PPCAC_23510, partial [Pristionchus entomophagus]